MDGLDAHTLLLVLGRDERMLRMLTHFESDVVTRMSNRHHQRTACDLVWEQRPVSTGTSASFSPGERSVRVGSPQCRAVEGHVVASSAGVMRPADRRTVNTDFGESREKQQGRWEYRGRYTLPSGEIMTLRQEPPRFWSAEFEWIGMARMKGEDNFRDDASKKSTGLVEGRRSGLLSFTCNDGTRRRSRSASPVIAPKLSFPKLRSTCTRSLQIGRRVEGAVSRRCRLRVFTDQPCCFDFSSPTVADNLPRTRSAVLDNVDPQSFSGTRTGPLCRPDDNVRGQRLSVQRLPGTAEMADAWFDHESHNSSSTSNFFWTFRDWDPPMSRPVMGGGRNARAPRAELRGEDERREG